jgi:hypothetical protein
MKYTIAALLALVVAIAGYFGIRHLARKDLGFTPVKRYATKLANTLLHTEATAAQEAGVSPAA